MISRRGFLARLAAAPIVALAVLRAPVRDLGAFDFEPFVAPAVTGESLGISIRFIRQFDVQAAQNVSKFDVLYGVGNLAPQFARVVSEPLPWWSPRRWFA